MRTTVAALGSRLLPAVLEALAPESCAACGVRRGQAAWAAGVPGPAPGLQLWHAPHCCEPCLRSWRQPPRSGIIDGLPIWAARPESADLVAMVGAWKYRGLRGLARPLAALLAPALLAATAAAGPATLVPIPLHHRRLRERGFDQTRQLACLAGRASGTPVADEILVRRRATRQQASEATAGADRQHNVAGAFRARPPQPQESVQVAVVDDLITTGATLGEAVAALRQSGWEVVWGAALGLAARLQLDGSPGHG